jgi:hypothetical protein
MTRYLTASTWNLGAFRRFYPSHTVVAVIWRDSCGLQPDCSLEFRSAASKGIYQWVSSEQMQSRGDKNVNPATSSQPKHQFPKQLRFPIAGSHPYVSFMCSVANHISLTYRLLTANDLISYYVRRDEVPTGRIQRSTWWPYDSHTHV